MFRLLLLIGLPFGVYAYWRYFANATREQREQRAQAAVFGIGSLVMVAVSLRRGSPIAMGLSAAVVLVLLWLSRQKKKGATASARSVPPADGGSGVPSGRHMTAQQALEVLGLAPGATREEIQQRYRQLMRSVHPDQGGSGYLAAQINRAHDVLLKTPGNPR